MQSNAVACAGRAVDRFAGGSPGTVMRKQVASVQLHGRVRPGGSIAGEFVSRREIEAGLHSLKGVLSVMETYGFAPPFFLVIARTPFHLGAARMIQYPFTDLETRTARPES